MPPGQHLVDGREGQVLEERQRHAVWRSWIDHIEEMVGDAIALRHRGFGDPDIHAPIEIAGIGIDDFAIEAMAEIDRQRGFAGGRRAADDDQRGAFLRGGTGFGLSHNRTQNYNDLLHGSGVLPIRRRNPVPPFFVPIIDGLRAGPNSMVQWLVQLLKIATILVLSGLVLLGGARAFEHFQNESRPDDIGKVYSIKISQDDTPDQIAKLLEDNGLINSKTYFTGRIRVVNSELEPGSYRITKGMTVGQIIDTITGNASDSGASGGKTSDNSTLSITVIEGWRTEQIADKLVELGWNGDFDEFMDAARNYPSENFDFLADRPAGSSLEGYLFPDTYNFTPDSSANEIIESMLNNFDAKVPQEMRDRAVDMGLSLYQVLTFASLVEREAAVSEERPIIADIYEKRYTEGWRLDADPTVQYVLGTQAEWWPELSGDDLYVDSPYNTYQTDGLPPGPIANPGYASIRAVLFPADSPYYYFFAKADGSGYHLFAATGDEQQQNIDYVDGKVDAPAPGSDPFAGE